jgi:hypothetical protein
MLKLDPTIPDKLEITEVHDILWERVGQEYTTCQHISDSIWVQMASPKIALKQRGASVMIKGASFTLEFTCYHCIVYVCRDVGGVSTPQLIESMGHRPLADKHGIELLRQCNDGPYAALKFDKPLVNYSSFILAVDARRLSFNMFSLQRAT